MESTTVIKNVRISPKKLRFLLPELRKLTPLEALDYLFYTSKKGAKILYSAVKAAVNNAKNTLKTDENLLKFKVLAIEEGLKLKRYQPGGRGTVKPYKKRFSHIRIVLVKREEERKNNLKKEEISEKKETKKERVAKNNKKREIKKTSKLLLVKKTKKI